MPPLLETIKRAVPTKPVEPQQPSKQRRVVINATDSITAAEEFLDERSSRASAAPFPATAGTAPTHVGQRKVLATEAFYPGVSLRLQHVEERVLRFLANVRERAASQNRLKSVWRLFPTQAAAFDCADREDPSGCQLRIFSVELSSTGKRKFLVTSYAEFWKRYDAMLTPHRHYYEIIRQGRPCHLYFDLEFAVGDNVGRDGIADVDALVELLREFLDSKLNMKVQDSWILELDSSTDIKFSRHLTIRFPGAAFTDNAHVGILVHEFYEWCLAKRPFDPRATCLTARKGDDTDVSFIDKGVYTRNRAFRLFLSSKAGKNVPLVSTGRFGTASLSAEQLFMATLVCNVPQEARLLSMGLGINTASQQFKKSACGPKTGLVDHPSYGSSPYPWLDEFIEIACNSSLGTANLAAGRRASIRSWVALEGGVLLYNIRGSRYCGNIGREHRSNGVFYVVDAQQGVWFQKCYDPDCRTYRSPVTALPPDLIAAFEARCQQEVDFEEDDSWDRMALEALEVFEKSTVARNTMG